MKITADTKGCNHVTLKIPIAFVVFEALQVGDSNISTLFLTSTCHRNYKKCVRTNSMDFCGHLMKQCYETEEFILPEPVSKIQAKEKSAAVFTREESDVNRIRCQKKQFYDQKMCRHLCSATLVLRSTKIEPISSCEAMCFELTRTSDSAGAVCPFQKYCLNGCPCPFYDCEKLDSHQKMIPVFHLQNSTGPLWINNTEDISLVSITNEAALITDRWTTRKNAKQFPIFLSDLNEKSIPIDTTSSHSSFPYERFRG